MTDSKVATPNSIKSQVVAAAIISTLIFGFILFVVLSHPLRIAPEAALHMECAMLILQGKQPFVGIIDNGSAALMYLSLPPALVHAVLKMIHPAVVYNVYVLLLAVGSTVLCGLILWRRPRHRLRILFLPLVVSVPLASLLINVEFGQREHLFMLLVLPYILLRWLRCSGFKINKKESLLCGISAGIAYCLDPLFLLPFIALELFFRFDKRAIRPLVPPELKSVLLTMLVYLGHFLLLPFSAFAYFTCIVPLNVMDYLTWDDRMEFLNAVSEMDWSRWTSPDRRDIIYWTAALCTVSLGLRRKARVLSPMVVLCLMGALTFILQGKALTYQGLVMVICCAVQGLIALSLAVDALVSRLSGRTPLALQTAVILCICVFIAFAKTSWRTSGKTIDMKEFGYIGVADRADLSHFAVKIMERSKPGDAVIILYDNVKAAYPLMLQINRVPGCSLLWGFPFRLFSVAAQEGSWLYTVFLGGWEAPFYEQLGQEIERANAKCILLQSGRTLDYLQNRDIIEKVKTHYKLDGDLTWHDKVDRDVDTSNLELWGGWEATQMYVRKDK